MKSLWMRWAVGWLVLWVGVMPLVAQGRLEVVFAYGSEKEEWIKEITAAFNQKAFRSKAGLQIVVKALPMGSGECMEGVQSGRLKAHVVSPASAVFIRLANADWRARTGKDLVPETENLVLSPVVIAMWKPMAEALGWGTKPIGWSDVLALAQSPEGWGARNYPQWGQFKLGHTHPDYSNSGILSVVAEAYAAARKTAGLTVEDVGSAEVVEYVRAIEQAVVHYGSSTGFFGKKMFANGPGYLSAAVLYENMVIESYSGKYQMPFPVVAIYPKEGTFWSDHPAGVVAADWVTADHKQAAQLYLRFLLAPAQQQRALAMGFRPGLVDVPLAAPIDAAHGVDASEPKTTLEVPKSEVVRAVSVMWREKAKKRSNVVLVLDTSGSMKEENRMENAKRGAEQMVKMLGDEDHLALMSFSDQLTWALRSGAVGPGRKQTESAIRSLWPSAGTALYEAIWTAHQELVRQPQPDKISAVVVLTDGQDTSSKRKLPDLMNQIRFDPEKSNVRIFTIGYGKGANREALRQIAEATQAKSYEGTDENINEVFKDIATFF